MASDNRKRQKKLERRAAKRKDKHYEVARRGDQSLAERLATADQFPILSCWATQDIWQKGMGYVCLSRQLPGGSVAFALFLIDRYCLGVKDVLVAVKGRSSYDSEIEGKIRREYSAVEMQPAAARKLVEDAVAFARGLGLPPHSSYATAQRIFGSIDASQCTEAFEFGQAGKPYFISGPYDTPAKCRRILAALRQSVGEGNFHFMVGGPAASFMKNEGRIIELESPEHADSLSLEDGVEA